MKRALIAGLGLVVVVGLAVAAWLLLRPEGATTARGTCGTAAYELEAEPEDDVLEVTFELQSAGPDETWMVRVEQDGASLLDGERRTDEDGELDLDVIGEQDAGEFSVVATPMVDGAEGEACTATLSR